MALAFAQPIASHGGSIVGAEPAHLKGSGEAPFTCGLHLAGDGGQRMSRSARHGPCLCRLPALQHWPALVSLPGLLTYNWG